MSHFKGVEFDPLLAEAGSNSFTMSPTRWVELTSAIGILTKNGAGGGTYAQRDIAFKFANWVSVEFELNRTSGTGKCLIPDVFATSELI